MSRMFLFAMQPSQRLLAHRFDHFKRAIGPACTTKTLHDAIVPPIDTICEVSQHFDEVVLIDLAFSGLGLCYQDPGNTHQGVDAYALADQVSPRLHPLIGVYAYNGIPEVD